MLLGKNPTFMGQPISSEGVGSFSLEKKAGRGENAVDAVLKALQFAYMNPRVSGALIGAGIGAATSPRAEDKNENARNTIGSLLGGALSGAIIGDVVDKTKGHPLHAKYILKSIATTGRTGPATGRSFLEAFVPEPAPPSSLVDLLGSKNRYSDKDLFHKYQQEQPEGEREHQFVGALRSLYSSADKAKDAPNYNQLLRQTGRMAGETLGNVGLSLFMGERLNNALIQTSPSLLATGANIAKAIRKAVSPAVTVGDVRDAKTRANFSDDQLRRLLKGLQVKQVEQHSIK